MVGTAVIVVVAAADGVSRDGKPMKGWSKGDRVMQPTYGSGTLVEVNEHHTVIDFDEHGRRTFATRIVTLQASSEPAPNKRIEQTARATIVPKRMTAAHAHYVRQS